jgi:hypothetical protein
LAASGRRSGAYVHPRAGKLPFGEWAERWFRTTADLKLPSRIAASSATRRRVRLPRIVRREVHFLTAWQVEQLAEAMDPRYRLR